MMYILWFFGVLLACLVCIKAVLWYEKREEKIK